MGALILADAATTWQAIGAVGSMLAALTALVLAFTLVRRQTDLTDRAAQNARTSADAAVSATRTAREALDVAREQLATARAEVAAARDSAELAREAARAASRPMFLNAQLEWHPQQRSFVLRAINSGAGPGSLTEIYLAGQGLATPIAASPTPALPRVVAVGGNVDFAFEAPPGLTAAPTGLYSVTAEATNRVGDDVQDVQWGFDFRDGSSNVVAGSVSQQL